jgi:hypothetical protein
VFYTLVRRIEVGKEPAATQSTTVTHAVALKGGSE